MLLSGTRRHGPRVGASPSHDPIVTPIGVQQFTRQPIPVPDPTGPPAHTGVRSRALRKNF